MAITRNAKKALRVSLRRRVFNTRRKKTMKDEIKKVSKLIMTKATDGAKNALPGLYKAIDKAAKNGTIKKNTAARMKSRLTKQAHATAK